MIRRLALALLVGMAACGGQQHKYQVLGQEMKANTTEREVAPSTTLAAVAEEMKRSCQFATVSSADSGSVHVEVIAANCQNVGANITLKRSSQGTKLSYACVRSAGSDVVAVPASECRGIVEPYLGALGGGGGMSSAPGAPTNGAVPDNLFGPGEQPQPAPSDGIRIED